MTTNQLQIQAIEARWAELVQQRMEHANIVMETVNKEQRLAVIQELNENVGYERQFNAMEEQLRMLDPEHNYLEENQINIY